MEVANVEFRLPGELEFPQTEKEKSITHHWYLDLYHFLVVLFIVQAIT